MIIDDKEYTAEQKDQLYGLYRAITGNGNKSVKDALQNIGDKNLINFPTLAFASEHGGEEVFKDILAVVPNKNLDEIFRNGEQVIADINLSAEEQTGICSKVLGNIREVRAGDLPSHEVGNTSVGNVSQAVKAESQAI